MAFRDSQKIIKTKLIRPVSKDRCRDQARIIISYVHRRRKIIKPLRYKTQSSACEPIHLIINSTIFTSWVQSSPKELRNHSTLECSPASIPLLTIPAEETSKLNGAVNVRGCTTSPTLTIQSLATIQFRSSKIAMVIQSVAKTSKRENISEVIKDCFITRKFGVIRPKCRRTKQVQPNEQPLVKTEFKRTIS